MVKPSVLLAIIAGSLIFVGCATSGRKFPIERIDEVCVGKSTRIDVKRILGKPYVASQNADGSGAWTYMYCQASSLVYTVKVRTNSFHVIFDKDGVVTNTSQSSTP